jgi:uncharacterized membrane protein
MQTHAAFLAGLGALALAQQASAQATFQGLGFLPGTQNPTSRAVAVSRNGAVVLGHGTRTSREEMFVWTAAGGMTLRQQTLCDCHTLPAAISDDGAVVVGSVKSNGIGAFRWTAGGGFEMISSPVSAALDGQAMALSANGAVIVGYHYNPAQSYAFRWAGAAQAFMGTQVSSTARAITADGAVIVGSAAGQLYRWRAGTGAQYLPQFPDGFALTVHALSADASVMVGSHYTSAGGEAVRWTGNTAQVLPGAAPSTALAVSADGRRIVGAAGAQLGQPVIWDEGATRRPLSQALTQAGAVIPAGWTLTSVGGISAEGTVIVGSGIDPQGRVQAWRAVLPRACYANCDQSTAAPVLNITDFTCFMQRYAQADPYANCDGSTSAPLLNVADFTCFLQRFWKGCPQ